jgi:hypothetical protein
MNFESIKNLFKWAEYKGQEDKNVTYIFVANKKIERLRGSSNILYIGRTKQSIAVRYRQETSTHNSERNTQNTNIRMTHIFEKLGLRNCKCYFVKSLNWKLSGNKKEDFLIKLETWDKRFFLQIKDSGKKGEIEIPIEKYLLVRYADDHCELSPMNNRL